MKPAVIFEDLTALPRAGGLNALSPLADLRSVFDIRTGALTTFERLRRALGLEIAAICPREEIRAIVAESHPGRLVGVLPDRPGDVLHLNARCVLPLAEIGTLKSGEVLIESATGGVIATFGPISLAKALGEGRVPQGRTIPYQDRAMLTRPWHVKTFRDRALAVDLALLGTSTSAPPPPGSIVFGESKLTIHPSAKIYPGVTFDLELGPILIDEHAVVRPGVSLLGPVYVGPHSTVLDQALIKGQTAIGPWCKVAGEVGGTIIQGYTNKGHDGHLGDSWLGEWVNLGAGTTNSNLLNTYAEVIAKPTPEGSNERTGEQFLGAIIGDHVKTAIGTRLMTGGVLHTGSMFATTAAVSGCVGPFTWATDAGAKAYRFEKFLEVAKAAMGRRKIVPSDTYVARLRVLCDTPSLSRKCP